MKKFSLGARSHKKIFSYQQLSPLQTAIMERSSIIPRSHPNQRPIPLTFSSLQVFATKMGGGGFEPPKQVAADLQSVPFGHSGIRPYHSDKSK